MAGRGKSRKERSPRRFSSKRARLILAATFIVFTAFCLASALLFVFPETGMPARVDAIVVLGGEGARLDLGVQLAQEDKASFLVLSRGLPWLPPGICTQDVGPAKVICFKPNPATTQGEAQDATKIAKRYGWTSLVLVTSQDQVWRAHLRFQRCYSGNSYSAAVPISWYRWPYAVLYQWAGTAKAETLQRSC